MSTGESNGGEQPVRERTDEVALESWKEIAKEIAAYLRRQVKTAQRWEQEEKLPVHRHSHKNRRSVYAYPSEIDAWRAGRKLAEPSAPTPIWWRPLAATATVLLCVVMAGSDVRPVTAAGQASVTTRRLSAGREPDSEGRPSPDGQWFSYTSPDGDLAIYNLRTGKRRLLKRNLPNPTGGRGWVEESIWSPDGKQIAFRVAAEYGRFNLLSGRKQ